MDIYFTYPLQHVHKIHYGRFKHLIPVIINQVINKQTLYIFLDCFCYVVPQYGEMNPPPRFVDIVIDVWTNFIKGKHSSQAQHHSRLVLWQAVHEEHTANSD